MKTLNNYITESNYDSSNLEELKKIQAEEDMFKLVNDNK